jgi:dipeptidyl aminopeptidase/acylaminoacyl peptidase
MRSSKWLLALCALSLGAPSFAAKDSARMDKNMNPLQTDTKPAATPVTRWLVLGPALDPLPAFHGEKPGSYGVEDLLKAERFPARPWRPAEGSDESWFGGGRLSWAPRDAGPDGLVSLAVPEGVSEGRPATAWLAAYVTVDRYRSLSLEVRGSQPRRAWLDGDPVAMGGTEKDAVKPADVEATLGLTAGKHVLVLLTVLDPARTASWTVGASLHASKEAGGAAFAATLDPAWDLDVRDVLDAPQITALAVSPEGTEVAVTLSRVIPSTDDAESWLEIRSAADGALLRAWRGSPAVKQVAWDPEGRWLSYVTEAKGGSGDPERSTLWVLDRRTQEVRPLLERVENLSDYLWSPDGRALVFASSVKPEPDKRGVTRFEGLLDRQKDYRTKSYLHLVTVPEGTRRRLTAGALTASGAAFSPDGRKLLFVREVEDFGARPYTRKEIWEIDLSDFSVRKLRDGRWIESAQYSPDGKRILFQAGPSEFGSEGVHVPDGTTPNEGDGQLYVWDPATSQVEAITRDFDPSVISAVWSRADRNIYLKAEDRDRVRLFRYDVAQKTFTPIATECDVAQEVSLAARAPVAAVSGTSPWIPERLALAELRSGASRVLLEPAAAWFAGARKGSVEPWSFAASSGRTIDGRVYLPPGFDPARPEKYPAIVYYYGGTSPVSRDFGGRYPKEWWAAQGYLVYVLEPSGATGFGQAFSALHVNDWGEITSGEIVEGTRRFLEAHPYADPRRVGCIGASFGGFMTETIVTKTDLFAAAVSHAGISSISSYWGEGYWGYSYSALATAGSFPWNRRDVFVDRSPLFRADKARTPILLTHGSADTNVPPGESASFYTALKLLGVPVEFVQVDGMDHLILDHAKRIVWSRTILAWFDRWLKDQPEGWDALYPKPK